MGSRGQKSWKIVISSFCDLLDYTILDIPMGVDVPFSFLVPFYQLVQLGVVSNLVLLLLDRLGRPLQPRHHSLHRILDN